MFLIEKAVGKNYSVLEHDNETKHSNQTQITLQIVEPRQSINVNEINNEITETLTDNENDDNEPWGLDIYHRY